MNKYILAIESSCDETACSIVKNNNEILSNVVSSQINTHKLYGGVVPEVASRIHVENISTVIDEAIKTANIKIEDISAIAITQGPGLVGSLHVGIQAAKTLSWLYDIPIIPIHHIIGHIYANAFVDELEFPLLALVVSGGHTELVSMKDKWSFEVIGTTGDDAIGEAYDKVARVLGLGYPGGPVIDKLAKQGKENYTLPTVKVEADTSIVEAIVLAGFATSKGQAKTLIAQNGITLNDETVTDIQLKVTAEMLEKGAILRKGKKNYCKLVK